jgi:N-acetylglucosamine malate deacetylase 1
MKVLVVAPHADDESLGCGGVIAKLSNEGHVVTVAVVTSPWKPLFGDGVIEQIKIEFESANKILGVKATCFMDIPVVELNVIPTYSLNKKFEDIVNKEKPELVFLPFVGDRHDDHRYIFDACMVALRPTDVNRNVKQILCYETVSETHWSAPYIESNFNPQLFVDISDYMDVKIKALSEYRTQIKKSPNARSIDAVSALATFRGSVVGVKFAESFVVIRELWD